MAQLFVSYGRLDGADFARRLKADLEMNGYAIWMDESALQPGGPWTIAIERAICASRTVLAVLSPHASRPDSVALDEIEFALIHGRDVLPLRAFPEVRNTLRLCRRQWIDFTDSYDAGLERTLDYLRGEHDAASPPPTDVVGGLKPLDYGQRLAELMVGFTGRDWLGNEVDRWLAGSAKRAFVLIGEPGVGKSAVAAWLATTRDAQVAAIHFCDSRDRRTLDPYQFVASAVGQLSARVPEYAQIVEGLAPAQRRDSARQAFLELVVEPTRQLRYGERPWLAIVDSLDESLLTPGETITDVLVEHSSSLPAWVRIFATTRPEPTVLERIRAMECFELEAGTPHNEDDLRRFVSTRFSEEQLTRALAQHGADAPTATARIEEAAAGNFLVAKLLIDGLAEGDLGPDELTGLSPGLDHFYHSFFARHFARQAVHGHHHYGLLAALAVAWGPLPLAVVASLLGCSRKEAHQQLQGIGQLVRERDGGWSLFHRSLADWLVDASRSGEFWCDAADGHAALAQTLWAQHESHELSEYGLRYLVRHLVEARRVEDATEALTDLRLLARQVETGLLVSLVEDLGRTSCVAGGDRRSAVTLGLLEQTLRSDLNFLDRHRSALFQCLWNKAWWHDCAERRPHYEDTGDEPTAPVDPAAPRLSALLCQWRTDNRTRDGGPWLRSLRPPPTALGSAELTCLRGHTISVNSVAFAPDGNRVASGSGDGTVRTWDADTGVGLACLKGHQGWVLCVAWSPDGRYLASGGWDRVVRLWDGATGALVGCWQGHARSVTCLAFSPDGTRLASGSKDGTVRLWEVGTGRQVTCLEGHETEVCAVAFDPLGRRVVSGGAYGDRSVRVWDAESGVELACLRAHQSTVHAAAFCPDGARLVTGAWDRTLRIWDAEAYRELSTLRGHEGVIMDLAIAPDGRRAVSGGDDAALRLWDLKAGCELAALTGHDRRTNSVAFSPDGTRIVSGSADTTVRVWDAQARAPQTRLVDHEGTVRAVEFSPDGAYLATASEDATVRLWDARTGRPMGCLRGHSHHVIRIGFGPDGRRLVSASADGTSRLWDVTQARELACYRGHAQYVAQVVFSPDGLWIASGCYGGWVHVWNPDTGLQHLRLCQGLRPVRALAFSPDSGRLIAGTADGAAYIWDVSSGQQLTYLDAHTIDVRCVAFSPDGDLVATGSADNNVRLWNAYTGEELAVLVGHSLFVTEVVFSPDGKKLVSVGSDPAIRVWDTATGECVEMLGWYGDAHATAVGAPQYPWRARAYGSETAIESASTGEPVAWLPHLFHNIATHPLGRTWAGVELGGSHVFLFSLEDEL